MSGVVDNLENLDNKTLRQKCLEYDLPDIPITDTSRKLLIKRLRAAMAGGQETKHKNKLGRETVRVVKMGTGKESPTKAKASGRRSIGTSSLTAKDGPLARATVTQRRRSGRTGLISQLEPVVQSSLKRKAGGDSIPIPVTVEKTTTNPVRKTYVSEIVQLDDSEPGEADEEEPKVKRHTEHMSHTYISGYRNYGNTKPVSSLEKRSGLNYSIGSSQLTSGISQGKVHTGAFPYESPATRRYTVGSYKSSADGYQPEFTEAKDDPDAPYQSEFVRRLCQLKANPINPVYSSSMRSERKTQYDETTSINPRRGIGLNMHM